MPELVSANGKRGDSICGPDQETIELKRMSNCAILPTTGDRISEARKVVDRLLSKIQETYSGASKRERDISAACLAEENVHRLQSVHRHMGK